MRVHVLLYDSTHEEQPNAFHLNVRGVTHALETIPTLIERHLQRPHTRCRLDRYTVSAMHGGTKLWRIVATGKLDNGNPSANQAGTDTVVDRDTPRDTGE